MTALDPMQQLALCVLGSLAIALVVGTLAGALLGWWDLRGGGR